MKNSTLAAFALLVASTANAQTTTTTQQDSLTLSSNTTVSTTSSLPENLKGLTSETLRPEHFFPVLGTYTATGSATGDIIITLDETNKGIVWVNGLPQGKFKALMKKAPSTYKIPAQKTEDGKPVAEGSLFFNPDSKELTIVLGRPFDDADPTSFLTIDAKAKGKTKAWQYTGVKSDVTAVVTPSASQQ